MISQIQECRDFHKEDIKRYEKNYNSRIQVKTWF